ncbi:MAG: NADH-quinone oxidoreductase subunit D, partial [Clostridiales bacterium]
YSRAVVRVKEVFQSMDMVAELCRTMPEGEIAVPVKGKPNGEFAARLEQPRGEAYYYLKGNDSKFLERMRIRTPTNINIPFMVQALAGCDLADVPVIVLSIDPCISCTER